MQSAVEVTHVYPLPWKIVKYAHKLSSVVNFKLLCTNARNSHLMTAEKLKGSTDRRVRIRREEEAFIWEDDTPVYLRVAIPAKVVWKDVIEIKWAIIYPVTLH